MGEVRKGWRKRVLLRFVCSSFLSRTGGEDGLEITFAEASASICLCFISPYVICRHHISFALDEYHELLSIALILPRMKLLMSFHFFLSPLLAIIQLLYLSTPPALSILSWIISILSSLTPSSPSSPPLTHSLLSSPC